MMNKHHSFDKDHIQNKGHYEYDRRESRSHHRKGAFRDKEHTHEIDTYRQLSFTSVFNELIKMFEKYMIAVDDINDFRLFAKKYDAVEKKRAEITPLTHTRSSAVNDVANIFGMPVKCDPSDFVIIDLVITDEDMAAFICNKPPVFKEFVIKFKNLVCSYLDFKQKEKFEMLRKIKTSQKELPIAQYRSEILEAVNNEKVVIIAGDTGCGKSTQIPQYLLQAGYNRIVCTQPRRIACISLCKRVARETLSEFKSEVGYQIRFEKNRKSDTKILFITEGLLLRQASDEGMLSEYDVIVLDEVHERHLHGDFLLGITKCLVYQRQNIKLILMSATINIQLFANYFGKLAKVIQVPGRLYPIKLQYYPIIDVDRRSSDRFDPSPYVRILQMIDQKYPKDERGDVLMFLSGVKEITAVVEASNSYNEKAQCWCILPLHSSLSLADQDKVFDYAPETFRKCVVATNIAETSITIDGIRFVVDSGKVNEISYDPVCKMQRLKEFWVSKASAEQRKGRAGRTGPGVCFRLYSEEEYSVMDQYTTPEIQRVPLDSVLLQMIAMGLPDARKFPFIEPPTSSSIENAILALKNYNALTADEKLTDIGKMLSRLPVDIPLGKMLIMGSLFDQVGPVLSLAAALSVQSPFTNRAHRDLAMQEARKDLESDHGDPITLLNVFREWLQLKDDISKQRGAATYQTKKWCKRLGLEEQRFYEMIKLRSQFKDLLVDCGLINSDLTSVKSNEEMTSSERIQRHGELKQLKKMKRALDEEAPRKPKFLKTDLAWSIESEEISQEDTSTDTRDLEFRLKNNPAQVQNLLKSATATTYKDLSLLKIIFSSAIYPQIAIADEFNNSKTVKEQLYHTTGKPFVALHPNSYFASHSDVIQLNDCDIIENPSNFRSKLPISSKHQVIFYMSLLETTKPYLVNNIRMPGVQSILLFCGEIHSNNNFSRFVCDSWLEIKFLLPTAGEILFIKVIKARTLWNKLLTARLQGKVCGNMYQDLSLEILELLNAEVGYTLKRLLPADLKNLHVGPQSVEELSSESSDSTFNQCSDFLDFKIRKNEKYGGLQVTEYFTYNCLSDIDQSMSESWNCSDCEFATIIPLERLLHRLSHSVKNLSTTLNTSGSKPDQCVKNQNLKKYYCEICNKNLNLRSTDILKHRKQHADDNK